MEKVLYRKYRSKSLDDVVGQAHVTDSLRNALENNQIAHAYLFTGPKGVGKTSVARILAHAVNDLPYDETVHHLDIIEIDAASNRRIDEIRDLRDKVHIAPTSAKYKVYIIDEVHMLTKEAFNALLKTLEEPPAHVIFILATTELSKLPETIVSRTQHFNFSPITGLAAVKHLQYIAEQEGISLDENAAKLIANHGQGSFRDSISLLDRLKSYNKIITEELIREILGIAPEKAIQQIFDEVQSGTPKTLLEFMENLYFDGYNGLQLSRQLANYCKQRIISGSAEESLLSTYEKLTLVPAATDHNTNLEIVLLQAQVLISDKPKEATLPKVNEKTPEVTIEPVAAPVEKVDIEIKPVEPITDEADVWSKAVQEIKKHHNTLYGVVRMAVANIDGKSIRLSFRFPFHHKQISDTKNLDMLTNIVHSVGGNGYTITCILETKDKTKTVTTTKPNPNIEAINNIFGESEVLES